MHRGSIMVSLFVLATAGCGDAIVGVWEGDCTGGDEIDDMELTLADDGTGEVESKEYQQSNKIDGEVEWTTSGSDYEIEIEWDSKSSGWMGEWECELENDDTELTCKHNKTKCQLDLKE